jgi:hypothetical protein
MRHEHQRSTDRTGWIAVAFSAVKLGQMENDVVSIKLQKNARSRAKQIGLNERAIPSQFQRASRLLQDMCQTQQGQAGWQFRLNIVRDGFLPLP